MRCQALILDVPIIVSQANKKPGAYGGVVAQIVTGESYGAVMEKGSALKPFVDRAIRKLKANGTIGKLQTQLVRLQGQRLPGSEVGSR